MRSIILEFTYNHRIENLLKACIGETEISPDTFLKFSLEPFGVVMVKGRLWLNVEILTRFGFFPALESLLLSPVFLVSGASYEAYYYY